MRLNANVHNRFDIEVYDSKTNKLKNTYVAHNIVLNQMYTRLCAGNNYFVNIHFGTGTGTPVATRTSLFNHLGTKTAVSEELIKAFPISRWKQKITLVPSEYVGSNISEVGIAFGSTASNLVTHAMLKDSVGNLISIAKTDTDTVIIYATVFVTFTNNYENFVLLNMPNNNTMVNYLVGGSAAPTGNFHLKRSLYEDSLANLGVTANVVWTSDTINKQRRTDIKRFDINDGNGHVQALEFANMFRIGFPSEGVHAGQPYLDVPIGVGDGNKTKFIIPSENLIDGSLTIKVNGVVGSNYTVLKSASKTLILPVLPPSVPTRGQSVSLSADGSVLAMGSYDESPYLRVWDWTGTEWVLRAQPPSVPARGQSVSLSADGNTLAMGSYSTSPYLRVWDWTGTEWVLRAEPSSVPANGQSVALSADGNTLAMGSYTTSPYLRVWDWTGTEWVMRAQPPSVPTRGQSVSLSADGNTLAMVSETTSPYLRVWGWTGTEWVLRAQPSSVPANGYSVALSADGNTLAMGSYNKSPYLRVWDWTGTEWVLRTQPPSVPTLGQSVSLSADGNTLAMVSDTTSPYLRVWDWTSTEWVLRAQPPSVPTRGYSVALSADGSGLAMVSALTSPYLRVWSSALSSSHSIEFTTPPTSGDVITADYTVKGAHKTVNSVIDVSFAIQFGEGV